MARLAHVSMSSVVVANGMLTCIWCSAGCDSKSACCASEGKAGQGDKPAASDSHATQIDEDAIAKERVPLERHEETFKLEQDDGQLDGVDQVSSQAGCG